MTSPRTSSLSKSRFMAGLQCLKRLYLETYSRHLEDPRDQAAQAILDSGTAVGELARQRFPGGVLIEEEHDRHAQAAASTARAMQDDSIPSLFEAAFTFEGIRTRVDVLRRNDDGTHDLVEVKSSASAKPEHVADAAIQVYVLEGAGVAVSRAFVMHIDTSYVYAGGPYDLDALFRLQDVTNEVSAYVASLPTRLVPMWETLAQDYAPPIEIGRHCTSPYRCSFYGLCHQDLPDHYVDQLPYAKANLIQRLRSDGILDIGDIPEEFAAGLSPMQRRVREAVVEDLPYVGDGLARALDDIAYPLQFLDFETFSPALPAYPMTRPYQTIPFQWSLHVQDAAGELSHHAFLHDGTDDPREAFASTLLEAVAPEGDILVYHTYEKTITRQLAESLPSYQDALNALSERYVDLLALVRNHYYHSEFHGSFSLKAVLPALVPDLAYDDLDVREGSVASLYYARMIDPKMPETEREKLRQALLAYCERDTMAMVRVVEALRAARP
ncbi:MAG: DUF2779 domain-containing protein [Chloroflexota bacterium]|nr:DUF2779 domain-containing protein [Chloroflexota bacterium]MDE2941922.1 DUF2779 domain-containing protein [Chloroflexota bacterium]MDE3268641.1 DUF2779 domain-containing protein [Chloroflexota bacterium]